MKYEPIAIQFPTSRLLPKHIKRVQLAMNEEEEEAEKTTPSTQ